MPKSGNFSPAFLGSLTPATTIYLVMDGKTKMAPLKEVANVVVGKLTGKIIHRNHGL